MSGDVWLEFFSQTWMYFPCETTTRSFCLPTQVIWTFQKSQWCAGVILYQPSRSDCRHLFPTRVQWHHVGSLKPVMVGVFTLWKWPNASYQDSPPPKMVVQYQHTQEAFLTANMLSALLVELFSLKGGDSLCRAFIVCTCCVQADHPLFSHLL